MSRLRQAHRGRRMSAAMNPRGWLASLKAPSRPNATTGGSMAVRATPSGPIRGQSGLAALLRSGLGSIMDGGQEGGGVRCCDAGRRRRGHAVFGQAADRRRGNYPQAISRDQEAAGPKRRGAREARYNRGSYAPESARRGADEQWGHQCTLGWPQNTVRRLWAGGQRPTGFIGRL
jgi:hypothetical protein